MRSATRRLLLVLAVLGGVGGRAVAQPATPPAADAPRPEPPAFDPTGPVDDAGYVRCGDGYLAHYHDALAADPAGTTLRPDELLYDAAVCYEQGHALASAIAAFEELRTRFASRPVGAKALVRLGGLYAQVARFAEAATLFEAYAFRYSGEHDAVRVLSDATHYRQALGDDDRAIADTRFFVATFGARRPAEAADAYFALAGIYERRGDPAQVVKHYRAYLKRFGAKGGADKVVVAHARIGQLLWDQSCPVKAVDGACLERVRAPAAARPIVVGGHPAPGQCGPTSKLALHPVARDRGRVADAHAAFAAAIAVYEHAGGAFPGGDERRARSAYAAARFDQAEVDYEAFLRLAFPAGLDFDPATPAASARSAVRFKVWLTEKRRLGAKAAAAYGRLRADAGDPSYTVAAAARIGQLVAHMSDELYTAAIPASVRARADAVDAYCDALTAAAEPYEASALAGFASCVETATDLAISSSWSKLCERELALIKPDQFSTGSELHADPAALGAPSQLEPPSLGLE